MTLLLGLLIVAAWPASGLWVIGMFLGIDLIFSGTSLTMFALGLRNLAHAIRATSVGSLGTFEGRQAHQPGSWPFRIDRGNGKKRGREDGDR